MRVTLGVAALLLAVPSIAAAQEAGQQTPATRHVEYRDLDLRNAAGVKRLRTRIRMAAIAVCEDTGYFRIGPAWEPGATRCHDDAMASAEPRLKLAVAEARAGRLASVDIGALSVGRGR